MLLLGNDGDDFVISSSEFVCEYCSVIYGFMNLFCEVILKFFVLNLFVIFFSSEFVGGCEFFNTKEKEEEKEEK